MQMDLFGAEDKEFTSITPLRYSGGKTLAKKDIYAMYHLMGAREICSTFTGGSSFEIHAASKGIKVHCCDSFTLLIQFFQQICRDPGELVEKIEELLDNIGFIFSMDEQENEKNFEQIEDHLRAVAQYCRDSEGTEKLGWFYIRNRTAYQAMMFGDGKENCLQRTMIKSGHAITRDRLERLRNFNTIAEFYEYDFGDSIRRFSGLPFYCDPPYMDIEMADTYGGQSGALGFDHQRFFDAITAEENFIISYNDIKPVRELYKDFRIIEAEWNYPSRKSNSNRGNEVFIMPDRTYKTIF